MRTANPALKANVFQGSAAVPGAQSMTIEGTTNKTFLLLMLTVFSASWVWNHLADFQPFLFPALILGLIIGIVTVFKKQWAPVTAPLYAAVQGVVLGVISAVVEQQYQGIVMQAVGLTFGTLFALLFAYKSGLIKVTQNFRLGVVAATGGIMVVYLISFGMRLFGLQMPFIHESGIVGIGFSLFVVVIAALNLVLDFDFIERGAEYGAPKYMEWYGAFGLIVTLIWLYIEILRLLAKLQRR
ncbi:MAG: hypothetical protein GF333_08210 [Candidatus Omnitrophica bacterium]|nr:hypothetical protein [Candidatus Omnitrophota bacterium]